MAVQLLPVTEKSVLSVNVKGVAPRVTGAPLAVRVMALAQVLEVPIPMLVPQLTEEALAVKEAPVPVRLPAPAVPSAGVTVNVSEIDPVLEGVKLETVVRLQLLPELRV